MPLRSVAASVVNRPRGAAISSTPCTATIARIANKAVPAARVQQTIGDALGEVLEEVRAFDDFRSDALGAGRRSLAFALRFRAADRTLTDTDVAGLRQRAIDAVTTEHGARLR